METLLIKACDSVCAAMFIAKFTEEEIKTLKALRRLIDSVLCLCERKEEEEDEI